MRTTLAKLFVDTVEKNSKAYLLSGDHGYALFDPLRSKYPEHFINAGVAEQNMVGVSAGMAKGGFLPIVYGLGAFIPVRVLEQIKLDICYEKLQVILIGDGAGAVYTTLGVSHQTFEDISTLRAIPNIKIFSPADGFELEWCFAEALKYNGPSYIRIGKSDLGTFNRSKDSIGKSGITLLHKGQKDKPILFVTGSMVSVAMALVEKDFSDYSLYSVCQIKPLEEFDFNFLKDNSSYLITIEEHNRIGGLGSTITELISSSNNLRKVFRIGANDCFTKHCGTYEYVMNEHGLSRDLVSLKIKEIAEKN
jgi:transketolase